MLKPASPDSCPECGTIFRDKTAAQRGKFHSICRRIGLGLGLTPGQVKDAVKSYHFGYDEFKVGNKWYRTVRSSESASKGEYAELMDAAYRWAAENGVSIED